MKSFDVIKGISVEIFASTDELITNGVTRASLAIKENKGNLLKKTVNFGLAVGAKLAVNTIAPDSKLANIIANGGLVVTGLSLASELKSTLSSAINLADEKVEEEIKRLSAL